MRLWPSLKPACKAISTAMRGRRGIIGSNWEEGLDVRDFCNCITTLLVFATWARHRRIEGRQGQCTVVDMTSELSRIAPITTE